MEEWIIPCNTKYYDIFSAFDQLKRLNWKQANKSIIVGDTVYIYVTKPIQAILYKCKVNKVNLKVCEIDDSSFVKEGEPFSEYGNYMEIELIEKYDAFKYPLSYLREKGMKGFIQGPRRVKGILE